MSKIQELKTKHPEFLIDIISDLSEKDPSGTNKFLPFMVKASSEAVKNYFSTKEYLDIFTQLTSLVNDFHKYSELNLIKDKDIYAYDDIENIKNVIKTAKEKKSISELKKSQTIVLYEDNDKLLVKCLTKESAILYGKNTQWCTSGVNDNKFDNYTAKGILIYFIYKHPPADSDPNWHKIAFYNDGSKVSIWDATSSELEPFSALISLVEYMGKNLLEIVNRDSQIGIPNRHLIKKGDGSLFLTQHSGQLKEDYVAELNKEIPKDHQTPPTLITKKSSMEEFFDNVHLEEENIDLDDGIRY